MSQMVLSDRTGLAPLSADSRDLLVTLGVSAAVLVINLVTLLLTPADVLFQAISAMA